LQDGVTVIVLQVKAKDEEIANLCLMVRESLEENDESDKVH